MEPNSSFRNDDSSNFDYSLESKESNQSSSQDVTFNDQHLVPLDLLGVPDHWVQYSTIENALKERRALTRDVNSTSTVIADKLNAPTEYSLSSAPSAIDVVPRTLFGEPQVRPQQYYKFPLKIFCLKEMKISMNRLQLLALFDRDTNWFQVFLAIVLSTMVSVLGSLVLYLKFYEDLYAFLFCFVIAGSQYSLLKSVQPDASSPIHGFNKTVTYSRPIYFCLCSALLLGAHHLYQEYESIGEHLPINIFGIPIVNLHLLWAVENILSIIILMFPLLFSLGLFPQINTFTMYLLEQIDMHIFGSGASCSLLSSFLSVLRSILACVILYGPAYGGLEAKGTQHLLFSMFCSFLIIVSYHLSRCASDFTYIWALIKSNLIFHPDFEDKEDSKVSSDTELGEKNNQDLMEKGNEEEEKPTANDEIDNEEGPSQMFMVDKEKELDDPLPKKLQHTVTARLKNDVVICLVLGLIVFSLHCSTIFTVLQPNVNHVLRGIACVVGFLVHYILPQLRKHLPWLCIAKPILKSKEFGQFEVQNLSKIMWFESVYVYFCFIERNVLYPLIFLSALTADSGDIVNKFGLNIGTMLIVVCGLKCEYFLKLNF